MEQALIFAAGRTRYALRIGQIEQVLAPPALRLLPHAPEGIVGLVAWRAQLLPMLDLSLLAAQGPCTHRIGSRVLIVKLVPGERAEPKPANEKEPCARTRHFALLAERVFDVIPLTCRAPAFDVPGLPYLGGFVDTEGQPQLLLPDVLQALHLPAAGAANHAIAP